MRLVWQTAKGEEGLTLLDVAHYSVDEDAGNLQAHLRKGTVVNIPLEDEASTILRIWFHNQYQIEKDKLFSDLYARAAHQQEMSALVKTTLENRGSQTQEETHADQ